MLNGKGNENGIKINRSNQQKNKLHMQHTFFLISKKTNLHVPHTFCLSLLLFCTTTMLFCRTKTSNFLVTYFYGGIVVCACPIFCLLCSCSLLFFIAAHFHCSDLLYNSQLSTYRWCQWCSALGKLFGNFKFGYPYKEP